MIGLILFLIVLLILIYIVRLVISALGLPAPITQICYLLFALIVILWLFGAGGYHSVYSWRF